MAYRKIVDSTQQAWDVWEVVPSSVREITEEPGSTASRKIVVPAELQDGWLAFQSEKERRRIAPVPRDWAEMPDEALLDLLVNAPVIAPQRTR
jgi:hypothetical protein